MNKHLTALQKFRNTNDILDYIKNMYSVSEDLYIPAILNVGDYIGGFGMDFYVKLTLKHKDLPINKTWLTSNLTYSLPDVQNIHEINNFELNDLFIHNLIVLRNYGKSSVYQINPLLTGLESYVEAGVKQLQYVESYFSEEYQEGRGTSILGYVKEDSLEQLTVLKSFLAEFIIHEGQKWDHSYELVAEFEYRDKNHEGLNENYSNTESDFLDYSYSPEHGVFFRGSTKLSFSHNRSNVRSIKVMDLKSHEIRDHNPNHYDGDTEEGFVVFSKEAIELLKDDYFFYGVEMIEKKDLNNSVLVDYLGDRVVFWEAEYNKLPTVLKDKIDKYNIVPEDNNYISEAMIAMQLEVSMQWDKNLEPDRMLSRVLKREMFARATDMDLNFIHPNNEEELQSFINSIENLTKIRLEKFNTSLKDVKKLIEIRNNAKKEKVLNDQVNELTELYIKYCYAIYTELERII